MKINMGAKDSLVRFLIVSILYILVYIGVLTGILKLIAGIVGLILAVTAFFGFCPVYHLFGLNTCSVENADAQES